MLSSITIDQTVSLVDAAEKRIRPYIRRTYLEPSAYYSRLAGANVFFKC